MKSFTVMSAFLSAFFARSISFAEILCYTRPRYKRRTRIFLKLLPPKMSKDYLTQLDVVARLFRGEGFLLVKHGCPLTTPHYVAHAVLSLLFSLCALCPPC